jgi:8-oxo-dGTP diphosphatase
MVVTVNVLIFSIREDLLQVLLVKRAKDPFANTWSLPGGVIEQKESLDEAAERLLFEKTGVKKYLPGTAIHFR